MNDCTLSRATTPSTSQPAARQRGRAPVLDKAKQKEIVSLTAIGCSRRVAAGYVGCSPSTITRTAERVPAFAEQLARAEQMTQITVLRSLRSTATEGRYWRAGAWLLERLNPEDFAPRPSGTYTAHEVNRLFVEVMQRIARDLPQEYRFQVAENLNSALGELQGGELPRLIGDVQEIPTPVAAAEGKASEFCNAPPVSDMELTSEPTIANDSR